MKAEFYNLGMAKAGQVTPSKKPMIGASSAYGSAEAKAGNAGSTSIEPTVHQQLTRGVGRPFPNLINLQGVPSFPAQTPVSEDPPMSLRSIGPFSISK